MTARYSAAFILPALAYLLLSACSQNMDDQAKLESYEAAGRFEHRQSARPLVAGTIARGQLLQPRPQQLPLPLTMELLQRGRERFDIFCSVCHGRTGYGDGMVVQRGFPAPPSYHTQRLRAVSDGHLFDVISRGYGAMYAYAARVPVADRWAIVAYIRALQFSQHAPPEALPAGVTLTDGKS
jgi:mono/diheme cytochrome c family protein